MDDVHGDEAVQRLAELAHGAAHTSLLHAPALQHLMDLLLQPVPAVVVVHGLHVHVGQAQAPGTLLPVGANVVPQEVQVLLGNRLVLCGGGGNGRKERRYPMGQPPQRKCVRAMASGWNA